MGLDTIVDVSITTETTSVSQASFNVPLLCGYHTNFPERVREYDVSSGLAGLTSDGFASTSQIYLMAQALTAQNPSINKIKVGRRANASTFVLHCTPVHKDSTDYTIIVNGTAYKFSAGISTTVKIIVEGLVALMAADTAVTATEDDTKVILTTKAAGTIPSVELLDNHDGQDLWTRLDVTTNPTPGLTEDLAAIALEDNDWYLLCLDSQSAAEITLAATWTESAKKLFGATSGDTIIPTSGTGDIAKVLSAAGRARTFVVFDKDPHDRAAEAWAGVMLPKDPGTATWKFKRASGPSAMQLTATQIGHLEAKDCNYYSTVGGVSIFQQGVTASGEWIDVIQGVDWFRARLQERIYSILVNSDKVPFTNAGIGAIESAVWAQIQEGIRVGFLSAGNAEDNTAPTVTVPDISAVNSTDKINRDLKGVKFTATLAGAIHTVGIAGTISA